MPHAPFPCGNSRAPADSCIVCVRSSWFGSHGGIAARRHGKQGVLLTTVWMPFGRCNCPPRLMYKRTPSGRHFHSTATSTSTRSNQSAAAGHPLTKLRPPPLRPPLWRAPGCANGASASPDDSDSATLSAQAAGRWGQWKVSPLPPRRDAASV